MIKVKQAKQVFYPAELQDLRELINYSAEQYNDESCFIVKHKINRKEFTYEHVSFVQFRDRVNALGTAYLNRGYKGKRIAILSSNRYEWMLAHLATLCGIGISVPLDKDLPYDELESSLNRSYTDVLVFDKAHAKIIEELKANNNTKVCEYICIDETEDYLNIPQLLEEGFASMAEGNDQYMKLPINNKEVAILLFTSGTTSQAKAVMTSHYNIVSDIYAMLKCEDIRHGDVNMAFLPFHHSFGSTNQILMHQAGVTTVFCDGLKYIQKNIVEYKVSVFVCVPILIETIYKRIMATVKKEGKEKKLNKGLKLSKALLKVGIDARRKIFKDIINQLGGNIRYVISGASAMDPVALTGFNDFGIIAVQGYGMTEASPTICSETTIERKIGSIGRAMPGIEVAIDQPNEEGIGELIARGPNVMLGYYENEEETAKTLADGWLHTGDLAYVDEDGYVFICGRKKNVIVLKNGKNVYPEELETLISNLPYVEDSMVFGQPRHNDGNEKDLALCVKITYKKDAMKDFYGTENPDDIEKIIRKDIDAINETLPPYKQMLRLIVTDQPMIKTTTGKVKRHKEIEAM